MKTHEVPLSTLRRIPAAGEAIQEPQGPLWMLILVGVLCEKGKGDCHMTD